MLVFDLNCFSVYDIIYVHDEPSRNEELQESCFAMASSRIRILEEQELKFVVAASLWFSSKVFGSQLNDLQHISWSLLEMLRLPQVVRNCLQLYLAATAQLQYRVRLSFRLGFIGSLRQTQEERHGSTIQTTLLWIHETSTAFLTLTLQLLFPFPPSGANKTATTNEVTQKLNIYRSQALLFYHAHQFCPLIALIYALLKHATNKNEAHWTCCIGCFLSRLSHCFFELSMRLALLRLSNAPAPQKPSPVSHIFGVTLHAVLRDSGEGMHAEPGMRKARPKPKRFCSQFLFFWRSAIFRIFLTRWFALEDNLIQKHRSSMLC